MRRAGSLVGYVGLRFTGIRQSWLRETAERWAADELPRHRGPGVAGYLQNRINSIVQLSDSLHAQRRDHGHDPSRLGLGDNAWRESGLGAPSDVDVLQLRITSLEQQLADVAVQLAARDEDLAAARSANRELMAQLNHRET